MVNANVILVVIPIKAFISSPIYVYKLWSNYHRQVGYVFCMHVCLSAG